MVHLQFTLHHKGGGRSSRRCRRGPRLPLLAGKGEQQVPRAASSAGGRRGLGRSQGPPGPRAGPGDGEARNVS